LITSHLTYIFFAPQFAHTVYPYILNRHRGIAVQMKFVLFALKSRKHFRIYRTMFCTQLLQPFPYPLLYVLTTESSISNITHVVTFKFPNSPSLYKIYKLKTNCSNFLYEQFVLFVLLFLNGNYVFFLKINMSQLIYPNFFSFKQVREDDWCNN
jgi:hypothetical protein